MPDFGHLISLSFAISPVVFWGLFFLVLIVFVIMSLILFYHWRNFEFDPVVVRSMTLLYFFGGAAILFLTFGAVTAYLASL